MSSLKNKKEITIKPTKKQHEAWQYLEDDTSRFIGFGGGAGVGKSWLLCEWLIVKAIQYPGMRAFIARNELKRLMNSTFITFQKVSKHHKLDNHWKLDGQYNVIKFNNGSTIDLLDIAYKPTDPEYERFGSTEYTFGAIEEAGETHFKAFDVLKSRVGRHNIFDKNEVHPKILLTFNPSRNWVYNIFYKQYKNNTLSPGYVFIPGLYTDNPYTAEQYGQQLREIIDKTTKERLMYGNWEYDDEIGLLVHYDNVVDVFTNIIVSDNEKYLSVDVARYGSDRIVINYWEGLKSVERRYYTKKSVEKTAQLVRQAAAEYKVPFSHIIIDEDGVGGGVVDILSGTKGFVSNSAPLNAKLIRRQFRPSLNQEKEILNFGNIKSQCGFKLAELIETHKIAVSAEGTEKEEIIDELTATLKQKDPEKESKLRLIPKDEIKAALGRSPDIADTFIMRMYFELLKTTQNFGVPGEQKLASKIKYEDDYIQSKL